MIKKLPIVKEEPTTATGIVLRALIMKTNEIIDELTLNPKCKKGFSHQVPDGLANIEKYPKCVHCNKRLQRYTRRLYKQPEKWITTQDFRVLRS